VADFVRLVQTPERLRLLLVLTVADIRAVGPGVWNGWKGQLLRDLYASAAAVFRGGRASDAVSVVRQRQAFAAAEIRARLVEADPAAGAWAEAMEDAYFTGFGQDEIAIHAAVSQRALAEGAAAMGYVREDLNAAELVVAAADRPRLFADLARAITVSGASVLGARVFTSRQGQALDVFYLQDVTGQPFGHDNPTALPRLAEALEAAARGEPPAGDPPRPADLARTAAFAITPSVMIDNEASESATIVEAAGRDRPGLLTALASTLAEAGLSITSAHIDSYGERAVDAFYVTDAAGWKVTATKSLTALRQALLAVLNEGETTARPRTRARLERARASVAR
jgi:[protein-PII] uridylyltransferase